MNDDSRPSSAPQRSQPINRRQALLGLGSAGAAVLLAACGKDGPSETSASTSATTAADTPARSTGTAASGDVAALLDAAGSCAVIPELTEGPYYIDADAVRSDIREDRPGTALRLAIRVRNFPGYAPRANAVVDVWHCDAGGSYSGFESSSSSSSSSAGAGGGGETSGLTPGGGPPAGGPPAGARGGTPPPGGPGGAPPAGASGGPGGGNTPSDSKRYLRGSQVTGADGVVQFVTIYPGWYQGRTVHVHVKVHVGESQVVTSQLFFDETVTKEVYDSGPYSDHAGQDTTNANDGIFAKANLLTPQKSGDVYVAAINLDVKSA